MRTPAATIIRLAVPTLAIALSVPILLSGCGGGDEPVIEEVDDADADVAEGTLRVSESEIADEDLPEPEFPDQAPIVDGATRGETVASYMDDDGYYPSYREAQERGHGRD